jgi:hypothetical protein
VIGVRRACPLTGTSRASHYRAAQGPVHGPPGGVRRSGSLEAPGLGAGDGFALRL